MGKFIVSFRNIFFVPIPKTKKPNPNSSNSYRPISFQLSCVWEVTLRMVEVLLEWWIQFNEIHPTTQFGFRKVVAIIEALTTLVTDIQHQVSLNNYVSTLFIDIEG